MKKRRASGDLQPTKNTENLDARRIEFAQTLRALNSQFCRWVEEQNRNKPAELWSEGVEDYLTHAKELLSEYSDVIDEEEVEEADQAAAAPAPSFAPPAATGFGGTAEPSAAQQPRTGFGGSGGFGGGGATFGQPPSSSQAQQKQASLVDFLKTIPAPAAAAASSGFSAFGAGGGGASFGGSGSGALAGAGSTGLGDGAAAAKLPPLPFPLSSGKDGSSGDGGGGGVATALGTSPPAFNFSTAFGGGDSTAASSPSSSPAAAASQKSSGFGAFGSGTSGAGAKGFGLGGGGPAGAGSAGATGGVFGSSKPPLFGGASGGFGFGASASASAAAESSLAASAAPASEPKDLFSSPPSQPLPSLFSFASGNAETAGGFNFGSTAASAPAQNGNGAAAAPGDDDAPDENPEDKVKVQLDETGADILFRDNAKLYFQDKVTKKWDDRGRGNLTLRRTKQQPGDSGSNTPFLVFTMESGRVLLSAGLYKGLSMQQQKNMVLMTLEVADPSCGEGDAGGKSTMTLVNFRLKSAERGEEFQDAIKEHIPR